jgi:hypothetical protein
MSYLRRPVVASFMSCAVVVVIIVILSSLFSLFIASVHSCKYSSEAARMGNSMVRFTQGDLRVLL